MVVFGGLDADGLATAKGFRFAPLTQDVTPTASAAVARYAHAATYSSDQGEMLVWGGKDDSSSLAAGAVLSIGDDAWAPLPSASQPSARAGFATAWTGGAWIIWGGDASNTGAVYDHAAHAWLSLGLASAPSARDDAAAVWTGDRFLVIGGRDASGAALGSAGVFFFAP
jgi:hypothetical protein